jgi:hypothetical protein
MTPSHVGEALDSVLLAGIERGSDGAREAFLLLAEQFALTTDDWALLVFSLFRIPEQRDRTPPGAE